MAQRANLELIENIRPWIYKYAREVIGGSGQVPGECLCGPGQNIIIQAGVISLAANVVIQQELTIEEDSRLVFWDNGLGKFLDIYIEGGYIRAEPSDYVPPATKPPGQGCVSGRNITTSGGVVSLDADVIIDNSISFPINTGLRLWDTVLEEYLYLTINNNYMNMIPTGAQSAPPVLPPDSSECLAGDNIIVSANTVKLADYVVIRNTLAIPENSSIKMWDTARELYADIYMEGGYMKASYI